MSQNIICPWKGWYSLLCLGKNHLKGIEWFQKKYATKSHTNKNNIEKKDIKHQIKEAYTETSKTAEITRGTQNRYMG